ncbi:ATP-binding protein [Herpetosiphon geysericola]|uniref:ATP-binding protein n=1 Tax=Herpetosiphon geysericola TaxID=70996 RepID=UPI0006C9011A|nr:tetratricopeptide repeat protein [Herpetosiphon geysericola]
MTSVEEQPWTEAHIRLLLLNPIELLLTDPWRAWVRDRGGLDTVLSQIVKLPYLPHEQRALELIITEPGEKPQKYADALAMDRATFYRHLKALIQKIASYLSAGALDIVKPVPITPEIFQGVAPNVPLPAYPIIGRNDLLKSLSSLLLQSNMLTLTGPGGIGKTRLALYLAHHLYKAFKDGVIFVQLATVRDIDLVVSAIAQTVGISESGSNSLVDQLKSYFANKHVLLILDNFEQLIQAGTMIGDLISYSPHLHVLITSRESLRIYGEREYPIPTLALPDIECEYSLDELAEFSSVALFVQRASAFNQRFRLTEENGRVIAEICTRLDGLPLAIELIAARSKYFSPQALLSRLQNSSLALLTGGPQNLPTRQQTLRAAITWSYELLSLDERHLFCRIAVFHGGFTIDAVKQICNGLDETIIDLVDILLSLSDKSLLQQREEKDGEPRFFMLETLREYALEHLKLAQLDGELQKCHAMYYLAFVEEAELHLSGQNQVTWLNLLEKEHGNIRAALEWSISHTIVDVMVKMSGSLWKFWYTRGYITEGRHWLDQVLANKGNYQEDIAFAKALDASGIFAMIQVDYSLARDYHEQSLKVYRGLGNKKGISGNLESLAMICMYLRDYDTSFELFCESLQLRREIDDLDGISASLTNLGNVATLQEKYDQALVYVEEALEIDRKTGNTQAIVCTLRNVGAIAYYQRDYLKSYRMYRESLIINQDLADMDNNALCLEGIALSFASLDRMTQAAILFGAADKIRNRSGIPAHNPTHELMKKTIDIGRINLGNEWDILWKNGCSKSLAEIIEQFVIDDIFSA